MKVIKTVSIFIAAAFFLAACNTERLTQEANPAPSINNPTFTETAADVDGYVNDDFDLQRVGDILQRSNTPQEFESYLNQPDGINNLDLNGDGYADYISVDEFGGQDDYERGLSMYTNYGPDRRQDLGTVFFYRDEPQYPGARVVMNGNENIYGDNNFYETNWLEKSIGIISQLFTRNRQPYRSPYSYDNYPSGYSTYDVVDRPYYRTRVEQMYPQPTFVYTAAAPIYFNKIKIKSPNNGLHLGQIYGRLKKPTKDQEDFYKNNPVKPARDKKANDAKKDNGDENDRGKPNNAGKLDKGDKQGGKPDKVDKQGGKLDKVDKQGGKPDKVDKQGGKPDKGGKQQGGKPDKGGKGNGKKN